MIEVDVVIPTRDRATLVTRAIDSVLAQTMLPEQVIVVDDGSTDDTLTRLRDYGDAIRIIEGRGEGVSSARNLGVQNGESPWIAFLDSDDLWQPEKLERQCAELRASSRAFRWSHTEEIWIRNGRRVNPMKKHKKPAGWVFEQSLKLCCVSPSSVLLERDFLREQGGFDESLPACEDYALWLKMAAKEPIHFVDQPLTVKYGGHADQLSHKHWGMDRFRAKALEDLLRQDTLPLELQRLALENLIFRYEVLLTGASKRGGSPHEATWTEALSRAKSSLDKTYDS